jgi:hypothetical protein
LRLQRIDGLHPPGEAGESLQAGRLFPVRLQHSGERLLQVLDGLEGPVGERSPELLGPPLHRVQLRGVGGQRQEAHVFGTADFLGAVAGGAVEHDQEVNGRDRPRRGDPGTLRSSHRPCRAGRCTSSSRWRDRAPVQVDPFVGAPYRVRRAEPLGTITPPVPADQPEARLVEGQDLQRLLLPSLAAYPAYPASEVLLKASRSSGSAFSCRGRPVLSFTLRRLSSAPTLSG